MTTAAPWPDADVPVAIIGMAARSGGAADLDGLWRLIGSGSDAVTEIPADRLPGFDADRLGVAAPRAALLDRIDAFDAEFFGVSPRQAAHMDPRQRMLLEETWHALEDAAIPPGTLAGSDTGVFVGAMGADFRLRCEGLGAFDQYTAPGTMAAFLANRVSYQFDLRGCSVQVDTASSASLTAVVQAVLALSARQVSTAIAAGANVICHGFDQEAYTKAGILSPAGRARAFGEDADGYVRGDGIAVVVMKRLDDAERDGDPIRAVIRGVAQGHDGQAGGQFGPSSAAQAELIRRASARAGITPGALGYVEAHATGTRLGDRTEAAGLVRALDGETAAGPANRLWAGALKPVIGHTEGAAGVFGLIRAVLVLENESIPAIAGFRLPASDVAVGGTPVSFPATPVPWPRTAGRARLAGVSSYGLGGSGAHVVVAEAAPPARAPAPDGRRKPTGVFFPLSATTRGALARLAGDFAGWLRSRPDADLESVAWTLQTGRAALPCRAVLCGPGAGPVAGAAAELSLGAEPDAGGVVTEPAARAMIAAFLRGQHVDWRALWDGRPRPATIRLTGYPFQAASHWPPVEPPPAALSARPQHPQHQAGAVSAALGPAGREDRPGNGQTPVDAPPAGGAGDLARRLRELAGECLYLPPGKVDPDAEFTQIGLDSVLALEFVANVNDACGTGLTLSALYRHASINRLAAALSEGAGEVISQR